MCSCLCSPIKGNGREKREDVEFNENGRMIMGGGRQAQNEQTNKKWRKKATGNRQQT